MLFAVLPPPPAGMVATDARTVSCARTMPRFDVTGSSHGGPLGFEATDGKQYATVSASDYALIRSHGCRILPRRPAFSSRGLGRRWEFRAEYFEVKQFGCTYGGRSSRTSRSNGRAGATSPRTSHCGRRAAAASSRSARSVRLAAPGCASRRAAASATAA